MKKGQEILSLLVVAFSALHCAEQATLDPATGLLPLKNEPASLVIENLEWEEATSLSTEDKLRERSRAVGYLALPEVGARCTAFLVSPSVLMTSRACALEESMLKGAKVYFRREEGVPKGEWAEFSCQRLIGEDPLLNYALIECADQPGLTHGVLELAPGHLAPATNVYLLHQSCNYFYTPRCGPTKKMSPGVVVENQGSVIHDADALAGALGAPLLSMHHHQVVGLHLGGALDASETALGNRAVPAGAILDSLRRRYPDLALGPYSSVYGAPEANPDSLEPNEDESQGTVLEKGFLSTNLSVHRGDRDVFILEASADFAPQVEILFQHKLGDLDAVLYYREISDQPIRSAVSADDDEFINLKGLRYGTYYLVVYGYGDVVNNYSLRVR